jgi:hypothetical protein
MVPIALYARQVTFVRGGITMAALALGMFVALFVFGGELLGYRDPTGMVKLALVATFVFGILCGSKIGR